MCVNLSLSYTHDEEFQHWGRRAIVVVFVDTELSLTAKGGDMFCVYNIISDIVYMCIRAKKSVFMRVSEQQPYQV